ncbi:mitotic spindle checkpoint component mad2 [Phlyctochytrium arcticum]|nr:mitotic spindle checkpoint component mad2 [Phlyctochytrium arcticum]
MTITVQKGKTITLRGSVNIVVEFFKYSINSILFQRGLYPPEDFRMVKKYGLNLLVTSDDGVQTYLNNILEQLNVWIAASKISRMVMVISSRDSREVVERWSFDIQVENDPLAGTPPNAPANAPPSSVSSQPRKAPKTEKEVNAEIAAVMRQITASVTFLPMLDEPCTFNILAYTDKDAEVPAEWVDSDARLITKNAEQVKLRSFSTSVHKVDGLVAYRLGED